jgi:hypothetical protein
MLGTCRGVIGVELRGKRDNAADQLAGSESGGGCSFRAHFIVCILGARAYSAQVPRSPRECINFNSTRQAFDDAFCILGWTNKYEDTEDDKYTTQNIHRTRITESTRSPTSQCRC